MSTNIEVLNDLSNPTPNYFLLLNIGKIYKLYSTYIDSYKKLLLMSGDEFTPLFNQTLTSTGGLSSSEPNFAKHSNS